MSDRPLSVVELAGGALRPATPEEAVLVIVDAQLEYVSGRLPLAGIAAAVAEAQALLAMARRRRLPVIHVVQHSARGRGLFEPGTPGAEIIPGLEPAPGETLVTKTLPNAFAGTSLAAEIAATGRRSIILAGFMTHMCISATARAALDLGLPATVVAAATATRDIPDPLGGPAIPAATVHRTALAELADRFAAVVADAGVWVEA